MHTLGAGTDASTPWLRGAILATAVPITTLFLVRLTTPWRNRRRQAAREGRQVPASRPTRVPARRPAAVPELEAGRA